MSTCVTTLTFIEIQKQRRYVLRYAMSFVSGFFFTAFPKAYSDYIYTFIAGTTSRPLCHQLFLPAKFSSLARMATSQYKSFVPFWKEALQCAGRRAARRRANI